MAAPTARRPGRPPRRRGGFRRSTALARPTRGRLLGGVCTGVADATEVPVGFVRFGFLLAAVAGGVGIVAYAAAMLLLPATEAASPPPRERDLVEDAGLAAILLGGFLALRAIGLWPGDLLATGGVAIAAGVALVWDRGAGTRRVARPSPMRLAIGTTCVVLGSLGVAAANGPIDGGGRGVVAFAIVLAGLALVVSPGLGRLFGDLRTERRERIRSEERAEISAHLHDSVLQTLTLIQRRAGDDREVQRLARRQERELRTWLLSGRPDAGDGEAAPVTLSALVAEAAGEVEDDHGVRVEVVTVGDAPADDGLRALVLAGREAMANAARHAGVAALDVFLEVESGRNGKPSEASLFVRDRGAGFDPEGVGDDRRGVSDSIIGRMSRAGGSAQIHSTPGEGTEVELRIKVGRTAA